MRSLVLFVLVCAGCTSGALSPQDHANLWSCYAQLHGVASSCSCAQTEVPACFALVDGLKAEGQ